MFGELLSLTIASARRYDKKFAILFIDLDRFKFVNDTLGHGTGDELLKEMSARLKECLRESDVAARLGGDEFVILIQEVGEESNIASVARKILSSAMKPLHISGQECRVTASIGISLFPADGQDAQTLMKNADIAMYLAKEEGKNNFQFYSQEIKSRSHERMLLEKNLRRALELNEFSLHYQAKTDLKTGVIIGTEALLRWQNPELGSVSPAQFIPVAEEIGLIIPIGRWVLQQACAQNVAWQRQGLPKLCMAVNLSPRQFNDPELIAAIVNTLRDTDMEPHLLELEITESMVMHNTDRAIRILQEIKEMGVRLAIDDFGTGYSSLAQLKRFPIDTLKVDRSFIRDIPNDAEDSAITEAIIAMGKTLGLTVVAEGVETEEQQNFLRRHACDQMQGYYFSKPIDAERFAELLKKNTAKQMAST
jgi:diguanylate cyclase (GGDEF)-like protein